MGDPATTVLIIGAWLIGCMLVRMYATGKGLDGAPYFIASIFLSPAVGFIAAAAANAKLPAPLASSLKKCPDCAELIQAEARKCHFCGKTFELAEVNAPFQLAKDSDIALRPGMKRCPKCSYENPVAAVACSNCDEPLMA